jgi:hypothetical protein
MRVLRRPMFRGGIPQRNEGIMDGLVDRKGYATGPENPYIKEAMDAFRQIEAPRDTSLSEMLVGGGLNLMSGRGAGSGLMSNVAQSFKGPSEKYFKSSRAAGDYDRKLRMAATEAGLQQKWQLEQIKAKTDPGSAMYNIYLDAAVKDGYDAPEAQRIATYQITTKTELQDKVGRERLGGIIEFDLTDKKQRDKQVPKLKGKVGQYFFDPYDGKIKRLVSKDGRLFFEEFDSVADITLLDDDVAETSTKSPYLDTTAADVPTEEDIFARRFP